MKYIDEEFKLNTENYNIKPNVSLNSPSLYPPYIANNDSGYPVFVKIPQYPHITVGDSITVSIEGASSPSYTITQEDIDNEIIIYIDRSNIPKDKIVPGQNIKISYMVEDNDDYEDENLSTPAFLKVVNNSSVDIPKVKLFADARLTIKDDFILNRYTTLFGLNSSDIKDKNIKKSYLILSSIDRNFTYYDYYDYQQLDKHLVFLVESLKIYNLAGEDINAWIVLITDKNGEDIIESTPITIIKSPKSINIGSTGNIGIFYDNYTVDYQHTVRQRYIDLCLFKKDNIIKIGDVVELQCNSINLNIPITLKNFSKNMIIPLYLTDGDVDRIPGYFNVNYSILQGTNKIIGNSTSYS